jgi:hypothetical protein
MSSLQLRGKRINIGTKDNNDGVNGDNGVRLIEASLSLSLSLSSLSSSSSSRWVSHQLASSLLNEIFGYLSGSDRLIRVERTCRYWSNNSKNGIGWYHLDLNEWRDPFHWQRQNQWPTYPWPVLYSLLNKRLIGRRTSHNQSTSSNNNGSAAGATSTTLNKNSRGFINNNNKNWVRSISGNLTIHYLVDILKKLKRLQYADK